MRECTAAGFVVLLDNPCTDNYTRSTFVSSLTLFSTSLLRYATAVLLASIEHARIKGKPRSAVEP